MWEEGRGINSDENTYDAIDDTITAQKKQKKTKLFGRS